MKRPKFSIGSWAFSFGPFEKNPWSFDKFLAYARNAKYDGIEINGFMPHPHPDVFNTFAKCKDLKNKIEDFGLGISGYAPDFRDVPPAEVSEDKYLELIRKTAEFCNHLEINTLRIDTISHPNRMPENEYITRFNRLSKTWHSAAELCLDAGIKLVWEFEPGFWLNKPSEIIAIVENVGHKNFKVLFDSSHAYMCSVIGARQSGEKETLEGGINEFAKLLKDHIGHFHLIDSDGTLHNNETSTHAPFGQGFINFHELIRTVRQEVESLSWWCFDFCFCPTTEEDGKKAIPFVEKILKEIE